MNKKIYVAFKYFATNRISTKNDAEIGKYLTILFWYFTPAGSPFNSLPDWLTKGLVNERRKFESKLYWTSVPGKLFKEARLKKGCSLKNLSLLFTARAGFLEEIIWADGCFKLRLFCDEELYKKGLRPLVEAMRQELESGPRSKNLEVKKEIEEINESKEFALNLGNAKKEYVKYLDKELDKCSKYISEADEGNDYDLKYWKDELHELKIRKKYINEEAYKSKMQKTTSIFECLKEDFISKFPEKKEILENIAYGTFPMKHPLNEANGRIADARAFLPTANPYSLVDAEIFSGENYNIILSIYPYVSFYQEINDFYAGEFFEDTDYLTALLAHEFGHAVLNSEKQLKLDQLKYLCDPNYRTLMDIKYSEQVAKEHKKIDHLVQKAGYGPQTKKFYKKMVSLYQGVLSKNHFDGRAENVLLDFKESLRWF